MYKPEEFNLTNAPKEMVQYVLDNVEDFDIRYSLALKTIDKCRCPLRLANDSLFDEIKGAMVEWCIENDELCILDDGIADAEEIFG